jgi:hypothetical protein
MKETMSTSLGVSKQLTVEEVCVKLGCPQNRQRAIDLLSLYAKTAQNSHNLNLVKNSED